MVLTTVCCYQVMSEVLLDGSMFTRSPALVQIDRWMSHLLKD